MTYRDSNKSLWELDVAGSNPATPTKEYAHLAPAQGRPKSPATTIATTKVRATVWSSLADVRARLALLAVVVFSGCTPCWNKPQASWTGRDMAVSTLLGVAYLAAPFAAYGLVRLLWRATVWVWSSLPDWVRWPIALVGAWPLLALLTGCADPRAETDHEPLPQYEVRLDPALSPEVIAAALDGVDKLNERLGEPVFRAVVAVPGEPADWRMRVFPGERASGFIGYASFRNLQADVWLRADALDWTTFAHEALHCLTLEHADHADNLMFEAAEYTSLDITDAQVEQAMSWVHWCDWRLSVRGCL